MTALDPILTWLCFGVHVMKIGVFYWSDAFLPPRCLAGQVQRG